MYNVFKPEQPVGLMDFVRAAKSCVAEITPDQLKAKLDAKEDFIIEAAAVLQMMGFRKVLNLAGGIVRWEAEGKPQVREAEF